MSDYPIQDLAQAWALVNRADGDGTSACGVRLSLQRRILAAIRSPQEHEADWALNTVLHEIHLQGQLTGIDKMARVREVA